VSIGVVAAHGRDEEQHPDRRDGQPNRRRAWTSRRSAWYSA